MGGWELKDGVFSARIFLCVCFWWRVGADHLILYAVLMTPLSSSSSSFPNQLVWKALIVMRWLESSDGPQRSLHFTRFFCNKDASVLCYLMSELSCLITGEISAPGTRGLTWGMNVNGRVDGPVTGWRNRLSSWEVLSHTFSPSRMFGSQQGARQKGGGAVDETIVAFTWNSKFSSLVQRDPVWWEINKTLYIGVLSSRIPLTLSDCIFWWLVVLVNVTPKTWGCFFGVFFFGFVFHWAQMSFGEDELH